MAEELSQEEMIAQQKAQCIFCKIVKGEIPTTKVYEDDTVMVVTDINPLKSGHLLLFPKEHYQMLPLVPPEVQEKMYNCIPFVMKALKAGTVSTATTLFIANGGLAGQQMPHALIHLIPNDADKPHSQFQLTKTVELEEEKAAQTRGLFKQYLPELLEKIKPKTLVTLPKKEEKIQEEEKQTPVPKKEEPEKQKEIKDEKKETPKTDNSKVSEEQKKTLAAYLETNNEIRELLLNHPENLIALFNEDKELAALFANIDIYDLSERLNFIYRQQ